AGLGLGPGLGGWEPAPAPVPILILMFLGAVVLKPGQGLADIRAVRAPRTLVHQQAWHGGVPRGGLGAGPLVRVHPRPPEHLGQHCLAESRSGHYGIGPVAGAEMAQ
ncbi:hypothetical protein GB937_010904, partial [Aspergillus fischeri]